VSYSISKPWVENYKKYIHYDVLHTRRALAQSEDHWEKNNPGMVLNPGKIELEY
jgi:hypothetical protein